MSVAFKLNVDLVWQQWQHHICDIVSVLSVCVFAEVPGVVPASSQVYVRCSDPNVICTSDVVQHGEPHDVVFKVCFLFIF